jgi:hypothetical protein
LPIALIAAFRPDQRLLEGTLLDIIRTFEGKPVPPQIGTAVTERAQHEKEGIRRWRRTSGGKKGTSIEGRTRAAPTLGIIKLEEERGGGAGYRHLSA